MNIRYFLFHNSTKIETTKATGKEFRTSPLSVVKRMEGESMRYKFTDAEEKILLKNLVIICDTREQRWEHIKEHFDKKKIKYKVGTLKQGDYSCYIESNAETKPLGVIRDWYFNNDVAIEKKNSVEELASSIKDRDRFENEFARLKMYKTKILMFVEDKDGYEKIAKGNYNSQYGKDALMGSLETFIARYDINVQFIDKKTTGYRIYKAMRYHVRELLINKGWFEDKEETQEEAI